MKKTKVTLLCMIFALCVTACVSNDNNKSEEKIENTFSTEEETTETVSEIMLEEDVPTEQQDSADWQNVYTQVLQNPSIYFQNGDYNAYDECVKEYGPDTIFFYISDIDNDSVPELLLDDYNGTGELWVLKCLHDNSVVIVCDAWRGDIQTGNGYFVVSDSPTGGDALCTRYEAQEDGNYITAGYTQRSIYNPDTQEYVDAYYAASAYGKNISEEIYNQALAEIGVTGEWLYWSHTPAQLTTINFNEFDIESYVE